MLALFLQLLPEVRPRPFIWPISSLQNPPPPPVVVAAVVDVDVNAKKKFCERHKIYGITFITFSLFDPPTLLVVFAKFNYILRQKLCNLHQHQKILYWLLENI